MCVCVCLYVEPVPISKDYVPPRIKIGSLVCLYTPVSPSVPEMKGMPLGASFFEDAAWWSLYILYLLECQVELP